MSWLDKIRELIGKKKEDGGEDIKKQLILPDFKLLREDKIDWDRKVRECGVCKQDILPEHSMRKEPGTAFYFHTSCIRAAKDYLGV